MATKTTYFDNAASTRLDERVLEAMKPYFFDVYAVATSEFGYSLGIEAREALQSARKTIAGVIAAKDEEIIFTSGDTESSNMALKGVAQALGQKKGKHLIVSKIEDFPVLNSARALEKQGFQVTYLDVDSEGFVDLDQLRSSITKQTILVSIQHANQEIGTVQDIAAIAAICRQKEVLFHSDATHTFTRLPLNVATVPVDMLTISAHTIHGPRGIGALYLRGGTPLAKWLDGGFQEFNLRAGLENIPAAVGFAHASQLVTAEENLFLQSLREQLITDIFSRVADVTLNGPRQKRTPQNSNITFHYVEGESLTLHLDMRGFAVSTGSACFSRSLEASHVIRAIGGDHERAHGSVRFTCGRFNTAAEIGAVCQAVAEVVGELRRISPLGKTSKGETT